METRSKNNLSRIEKSQVETWWKPRGVRFHNLSAPGYPFIIKPYVRKDVSKNQYFQTH